MKTKFLKAIMGGFFVALGALGFVLTPSMALGSLVFSVGILLSIISNKLLFAGSTEEMCYACENKWGEIFAVLGGNIIGSAIFAIIIYFLPTLTEKVGMEATQFMTKNFHGGFLHIGILGFVGGILLSVSYLGGKILDKDGSNLVAILALIVPIIIFCLGGFEYISASTFYLVTLGLLGVFPILQLLTAGLCIIIGNFLGAALIGLTEKMCD